MNLLRRICGPKKTPNQPPSDSEKITTSPLRNKPTPKPTRRQGGLPQGDGRCPAPPLPQPGPRSATGSAPAPGPGPPPTPSPPPPPPPLAAAARAGRWRSVGRAVRRDVQLAGEAGRRAGARRWRRRGPDGDGGAAGPLPPQAAAAGGTLPLP